MQFYSKLSCVYVFCIIAENWNIPVALLLTWFNFNPNMDK